MGDNLAQYIRLCYYRVAGSGHHDPVSIAPGAAPSNTSGSLIKSNAPWPKSEGAKCWQAAECLLAGDRRGSGQHCRKILHVQVQDTRLRDITVN